MTVAELVHQSAARLAAISDSSTLDAELLLAETLGCTRTDLLVRAASTVPTEAITVFNALTEKRAQGVPVAYLTGRQAFFDFDVLVTPDTLIPRPFTEILVDHFEQRLDRDTQTIADIGTGSGAIVLALARRRPSARMIATDVSLSALRVAAANARRLDLLRRIDWRSGSLLSPLRPDDKVTAIIANLPYLPTREVHEPSLQYEPPSALAAGDDGLFFIERLIHQLPMFPSVLTVALELLPSQADTVAYWLRQQRFQSQVVSDGLRIRGLVAQQ